MMQKEYKKLWTYFDEI